METGRFRKDKTPYFIFACYKCTRWLFVKTSQKTKKCFACNKIHYIAKLPTKTEKVFGLSNAIDAVKKKQNKLAMLIAGYQPDLRSENEFHIKAQKIKNSVGSKNLLNSNGFDGHYSEAFQTLLIDLYSRFTRFPKYMIKIMVPEYAIPESEISLLISEFARKGVLIPLKNEYYTLRSL